MTIQNLPKPVRAKDIVKKMRLSKPSVSRMLKQLETMGVVCKEDKTCIAVTEEGQRQLAECRGRMELILSCLEGRLGVSPETAREAAYVLIGNLKETALEELCGRMAAQMP